MTESFTRVHYDAAWFALVLIAVVLFAGIYAARAEIKLNLSVKGSIVMRMSTLRKKLINGAAPLAGFHGNNDVAIQLVQAAFPDKPWCLVRDWVIFDVTPERLADDVARGLQPTRMYADSIVLDLQHRWEAGEWVCSSSLKSFTQGCLFETENTVYVLLGDGYRTGA